MKIVAILQTFNEQRFVGGCLDHLAAHGISAYLIDNESTDETIAVAERRLAHNLIGIETLPRDGHFALHTQLVRKEELAQTLDADWFIHLDADEFRVTPDPRRSLSQAIAEIDDGGYNAVNFLEFAFLPTREAPDHDHSEYARTMRSYYPILPRFPHRLNAWKRQEGPVDLARSGGHVIHFPGLRMAPRSMYSRHYVFLSVDHATRKYGPGRFAPDELARGWHVWRVRVSESTLTLPSERDLRTYVADDLLDASDPRAHMGELLGQYRLGPAAAQHSRGWLARTAQRARLRARGLGRSRRRASRGRDQSRSPH